jgi:AcrR family transcriptional regulator
MGNREDLLAGALACLKTKGWTLTTVRDIAAAAGVNHAAIGYHFGSREALLIEAFTQAMDAWSDEGENAVRASLSPDADGRTRYEAFWRQVIGSYAANRWLWLATIEAAVQAEHSPKLRELLAAAQRQGRLGLAAGLLGTEESGLDESTERTAGSVQLALMSGVLVQWLVDPARAPTGPEIVDGLLTLADHLRETPKADTDRPAEHGR